MQSQIANMCQKISINNIFNEPVQLIRYQVTLSDSW